MLAVSTSCVSASALRRLSSAWRTPCSATCAVPGIRSAANKDALAFRRVRFSDPYSSATMQLHDTVLRMRESLVERGVSLTPEHADARTQYDGPGQHAMHAWEAYRAVAIEPAFDSIWERGDVQAVVSGGLLFE